MSVPSWLQNKSVVILETLNGFAIAPKDDSSATECVTFETFEGLVAYLQANFVPRAS